MGVYRGAEVPLTSEKMRSPPSLKLKDEKFRLKVKFSLNAISDVI